MGGFLKPDLEMKTKFKVELKLEYIFFAKKSVYVCHCLYNVYSSSVFPSILLTYIVTYRCLRPEWASSSFNPGHSDNAPITPV